MKKKIAIVLSLVNTILLAQTTDEHVGSTEKMNWFVDIIFSYPK